MIMINAIKAAEKPPFAYSMINQYMHKHVFIVL